MKQPHRVTCSLCGRRKEVRYLYWVKRPQLGYICKHRVSCIRVATSR